MIYSAEIMPLASPEAEMGRRRLFANRDHQGGSQNGWGALLTDLSPRGFTLQRSKPIKVGSQIWMKMSGSLAVRARVIWAIDDEAGCEFVHPLTERSIREMVIVARKATTQQVA